MGVVVLWCGWLHTGDERNAHLFLYFELFSRSEFGDGETEPEISLSQSGVRPRVG